MGEQSLDQFWMFKSWKCWTAWTCDFNSINFQTWDGILRCDYKRNGAFFVWNSWPQKWAEIQHKITLSISEIRSERFLCGRRESNSIKETCAHPISSRYDNKEACANNLSSPPKRSSFFFKKDCHSHERKKVDCYWHQSFTRRSFVDTSIQNGHKDGTSSRSRQTRTRRIISLWHREIGICWRRLLDMEHKNYQKTIGFGWLMKAAVRKELSTVWITRIPCVTFEPFKDTLVVFRYVHSLQLERVHLSQRLFVGCSIYFGEWIDSGLKGKRPSPTSSLPHTLESFLWKSRWRKLHDDYTIPQKVHDHSDWKRDQDAVYWMRIIQSTRSMIAILAIEVICDHHP